MLVISGPSKMVAMHLSTTSSSGHRCAPFSAHSHIVTIRHPDADSLFWVSQSRSVLRVIFSRQKLDRVLGHLNRWQPCPCQKQPCTRTTARYFGRTISGFPGNRLSFTRNRKPRRCKAFRIISSGLVFLPRIPDIILLRTSGLTMSAIGDKR